MRVGVTGSSGLIGSALVPALQEAGHEVVRFVRREARSEQERAWAPQQRALDPRLLQDVDAVVHLAGVGVGDKRWTDSYQALIRDSRVDGTTAVATAIAQAEPRPRVLLSASAVGWYGDTGDTVTDETGGSGTGFLAQVCREWEAATAPAEVAGTRVVHLRTGIVLSPSGGALQRQLPLFRAFLGAPLGSGKQWWPWISLDDEVAAICHLLTAQDVSGPVNLCAPHPVTNAEFTRVLGRVVGRPTWPIPVPGFVLVALLGQFARESLLGGQRLRPAVLDRSGYHFTHPDLEGALRALLERQSGSPTSASRQSPPPGSRTSKAV